MALPFWGAQETINDLIARDVTLLRQLDPHNPLLQHYDERERTVNYRSISEDPSFQGRRDTVPAYVIERQYATLLEHAVLRASLAPKRSPPPEATFFLQR